MMDQDGINKLNCFCRLIGPGDLQSVREILADVLVTAIDYIFDSGVRCSRYLKNTGCLDRSLVIGVRKSLNCFCSGPPIGFSAPR